MATIVKIVNDTVDARKSLTEEIVTLTYENATVMPKQCQTGHRCQQGQGDTLWSSEGGTESAGRTERSFGRIPRFVTSQCSIAVSCEQRSYA